MSEILFILIHSGQDVFYFQEIDFTIKYGNNVLKKYQPESFQTLNMEQFNEIVFSRQTVLIYTSEKKCIKYGAGSNLNSRNCYSTHKIYRKENDVLYFYMMNETPSVSVGHVLSKGYQFV